MKRKKDNCRRADTIVRRSIWNCEGSRSNVLDGKSSVGQTYGNMFAAGSCEGSLPRSKSANSIVSIDRASA